MIHPTPLYIVASPRQNVGKTLIARLLIDFLLTSERLLEGYDLKSARPDPGQAFPRHRHSHRYRRDQREDAAL